MAAVKFSKQKIQPNPLEVDYWVDITSNPNGGRIKYHNGENWVDLLNTEGGYVNLYDYYTKTEINKMFERTATVDDVESKLDEEDVVDVIKDIQFKDGDDTIQMVMLKHNNTTVSVTMPVASLKQLQSLSSSIYKMIEEIKSQYQPKLVAGDNITIDGNVINANLTDVDYSDINGMPNFALQSNLQKEIDRATAEEDSLGTRITSHVTTVEAELDLKADKSTTYTKSQVDAKLSGIYRVKGSCTFQKLPINPAVGDAWNITNDFTLNGESYPLGTNVVYTESGWDALSGIFDTVALEEEVQTVADNLAKETVRATGVERTLDDKFNLYLPLTGGALSGKLSIGGRVVLLSGNAIQFNNTDDTAYRLLFPSKDLDYSLGYYDSQSWRRVWDSGNFTPSNYLPLTGGTLTGGLTISSGSDSKLIFDSTDGEYYSKLSFRESGTEYGYLSCGRSSTAIGGNGDLLYNGYKVWHSNNDGADSGLDADLLDGIQSTWFVNLNGGIDINAEADNLKDLNDYVEIGTYCLNKSADAKYISNIPYKGAFTLYVEAGNGSRWYYLRQRFKLYNSSTEYTRNGSKNASTNVWTWGAWHLSATNLDTFVATSATKLQTARTIWGQSFDGTENVSGNLTLLNNCSIETTDTNGDAMPVLRTSQNNILAIGYGSAMKDYSTFIYGRIIRLRCGNDTTDGLSINSSGNVTIGSSDLASTNYRLYVNGATKIYGNIESFFFKTPAGYGLYQGNHYSAELEEKDIAINGNKVIINPASCVGIGTKTPSAMLHVAGDILATGTITQESQRDLKDIIDEKVLSLDDMNTINPTRFKWKDGRDEEIHYGGIAEDIQQIIPEVVHKPGDNLTVEYGNAAFVMVASLVKHVKELEQRLSKLEEDYKQLLLNNNQ